MLIQGTCLPLGGPSDMHTVMQDFGSVTGVRGMVVCWVRCACGVCITFGPPEKCGECCMGLGVAAMSCVGCARWYSISGTAPSGPPAGAEGAIGVLCGLPGTPMAGVRDGGLGAAKGAPGHLGGTGVHGDGCGLPSAVALGSLRLGCTANGGMVCRAVRGGAVLAFSKRLHAQSAKGCHGWRWRGFKIRGPQ